LAQSANPRTRDRPAGGAEGFSPTNPFDDAAWPRSSFFFSRPSKSDSAASPPADARRKVMKVTDSQGRPRVAYIGPGRKGAISEHIDTEKSKPKGWQIIPM
jgi:hypothetical protein